MKIIVTYRGVSHAHAKGSETGASLVRALKAMKHEVYIYGNYHKTNERINNKKLPVRADLLIYCECNDNDTQYTELKDYPAQVKVYWDFDIHTHPIRTLRFIQYMRFDHVFYASAYYGQLIRLIHSSTHFLPYAIDPYILPPIDGETKEIDVALLGTPYPERVTLISRLRAVGIDAHLITDIYEMEMLKKITSFKIHLNYNPMWGTGILTGRVWETLGCGTLLLNQDKDGIRQFFKDGKHLILYRNIDECITKIKHLLTHPEELDKIAKKGHMFAMRHHTFKNRALTIMDVVNKKSCSINIMTPPRDIRDIFTVFLNIGRRILKKLHYLTYKSRRK